MGNYKRLRTGDPCPCCGQPIKTRDPEVLLLLSFIRDYGYNQQAEMSLRRLREKKNERN